MNSISKIVILALFFGLVLTLVSFFITLEKYREPTNVPDECFIVGTTNHGLPLSYYKKFNENFSTYASINDSRNPASCKAFIEQTLYPSTSVINAVKDFIFWSFASMLSVLIIIYLKNDLASGSQIRKVLAMLVASIITGIVISSISYYYKKENTTAMSTPCPVLFTEKHGYPVPYYEKYSASCILQVGFSRPDESSRDKYLEDVAFWGFIVFGCLFSFSKVRAQAVKKR